MGNTKENDILVEMMVEQVDSSHMPQQEMADYDNTLKKTVSLFGEKYSENQFKAVAIYGSEAETLVGHI